MLAMLMFAIFSGPMGSWGLVDWVIAIIIAAAVIGIMYVLAGVFEIQIPPWLIKIFWIVVACVIGIGAIRFIASL